MAEIRDVSDASFRSEVLEAGLPSLVDFWGDHCPACRQISPILGDLAVRYAGRVHVVKLHAGENPLTTARFGILSMPTVLGFARGEVVGQLQGARPKRDFEDLIGRLLERAG